MIFAGPDFVNVCRNRQCQGAGLTVGKFDGTSPFHQPSLHSSAKTRGTPKPTAALKPARIAAAVAGDRSFSLGSAKWTGQSKSKVEFSPDASAHVSKTRISRTGSP